MSRLPRPRISPFSCPSISRLAKAQFRKYLFLIKSNQPIPKIAPMEKETLLRRLAEFELDDPHASLPFTARLAREQRWTLAFSARSVVEYKRFIALAVLAGHPVTPSEEVDQVWHLHLVYTRSYWQEMCADLLDREIHHGPTRGGLSENEKFTDWYAKTLASYEALFGNSPPADIWPAPVDRFRDAGAGIWVNSAKFWLVPKPKILKPRP